MVKKVNLANNIPVLSDTSSDVHSVCIGLWVKVGARNEEPVKNGISHFLEHMFFKGTRKRSAENIAMEIDSLGGELNAFTSSEYTIFYVKVLNEFMERAVDLLSDLFLNSTFPDQDIEKEKGIINEEISMVEDTPSDHVHELYGRHVWGETGLGQTVLGKREIIGGFRRDDLLQHIESFYGTDNIVISCSGNFNDTVLTEHLNRSIGKLQRNAKQNHSDKPQFTSGVQVVNKDLSEAHICLGLKGLPYNSEERYAMHLLNTILGSGFSSRLFQNVREKRGLVYSIYSYHASYIDTGLWYVYAGTDKNKVNEVMNITFDEITNLAQTITPEELKRAKTQLKGNLILALESTSNKMTNLAKQEIYYGTYYSPEEVIMMVESVTLESLTDLAHRLVQNNSFAITVYGPVDEKNLKGSCMPLQ